MPELRGKTLRPIFKYDPVRAALLVWMQADEADTGDAAGRDRMFFVAGAQCPDDYVRVAPGCEPPLYVPPIPDRELLRALHGEPLDLLAGVIRDPG